MAGGGGGGGGCGLLALSLLPGWGHLPLGPKPTLYVPWGARGQGLPGC